MRENCKNDKKNLIQPSVKKVGKPCIYKVVMVQTIAVKPKYLYLNCNDVAFFNLMACGCCNTTFLQAIVGFIVL